MSRSTFRVLFYLKRNAPKKSGLAPVMCRITVNGKVAQFSCKLDVEEKLWNVELGRMGGRSITAQEVNRKLEKIRSGVNKAFQEIFDVDGYVTAEKVRNTYLGMGMTHKTLLAAFQQRLEDIAKFKESGIYGGQSFDKYRTVYNHLTKFIRQRYKVDDLALKELAPAFITDFESYLRVDAGICNNTVWTYMMPLRNVINSAVNNGWIPRDPFFAYHISKEETKRGFLTMEEITKLTNYIPKKKNHGLIRDLFIFCVFTGLCWRDMAELTKENISIKEDGSMWIDTRRKKTHTKVDVLVLDVARHIIEKYEGLSKDGKIFPTPVYQKCNRTITIIATLCGIEKHVTWHIARHTFATTVCLSNDVPIETLSKMMGHTSIRTTQIYAKITEEKINRDMGMLSKKLAIVEHNICQAI